MSEKVKFTQGPWLVNRYSVGVKVDFADGWFEIAKATVFNEGEANAHLIAAAPELYEALEYALPYLQACVPEPRDGANGDINCVKRALLAMAKARGES